MRILSNKKYGDLVEFENLYYKTQKELDAMHIAFKRAQERNARETLEYANALEQKNIEIAELKNKCEKLNSLLRKANGSKGGLKAKLITIEKELELTKHKLEESMTDKYLIKKIPKGREKSTIKMHVKDHSVESRIAKRMYEENK